MSVVGGDELAYDVRQLVFVGQCLSLGDMAYDDSCALAGVEGVVLGVEGVEG